MVIFGCGWWVGRSGSTPGREDFGAFLRWIAPTLAPLSPVHPHGRSDGNSRSTLVRPAGLELDRVDRVVDGDTVVLDRFGKTRLIGIDTPETVDPRRPVQAFGKEASAFTRALCEGVEVGVEFDQERTDRYGRTLAYLWLADGRMVNAEVVASGHGFVYTRFPFRYLDTFRTLARDARAQQRGLYSDGVLDPREEKPL